jgi:hypothetical protein
LETVLQPSEPLRRLTGFDAGLVRVPLQFLLKQPHSTFDLSLDPVASSCEELFYRHAIEHAVAERTIEGRLPPPFFVSGHDGSRAPTKD